MIELYTDNFNNIFNIKTNTKPNENLIFID